MLLARWGVLADRGAARFLEGCGEQTIGPVAALIGAEVVDLLEIFTIDTGQRNELDDIDRPRRLFLECLELLTGEDHVLVLGKLVTLHGVVAGDDLVVLGADVLLLETVAALLV